MAKQGKKTEPQAVYVISVAAELTGVHPQTLRIYERRGLLTPARTGGGSRRYSDADVELLRRIAELTSEGMNLIGVKRTLELERRVAQLEAELDAVRSETRKQYRRDLVPLHQTIAVYEGRRSSRRPEKRE